MLLREDDTRLQTVMGEVSGRNYFDDDDSDAVAMAAIIVRL